MENASSSIIETVRKVLGDAQVPVSLHQPFFGGNEWAYVKECIDTGWVSYLGSYVDQFEKKLAEVCGVNYAVATTSGTAALHIAMKLSGIEAGDEVLMPALSFVASANAISYCGARPHFVDCDEKTLGIDADKLAKHLAIVSEKRDGKLYNKRTGQRIACILPVHIFGHPVDMDALHKVATQYGLPVVEDAAEALGSLYKGRPAGSLSTVSALSFNGNKIVTTGGGGAILTDDETIARRAKHLTTTAKKPHRWSFDHDEIGYNYRLPNINAALGCAQLEQLEKFVEAKRALAASYEKAFSVHPACRFFSEPDFARGNYWLNAVILNKGVDREEVLGALHDAGYLCRPVWTLLHKLPMYEACARADLAVSQDLEARIVNLPSSAELGMKL